MTSWTLSIRFRTRPFLDVDSNDAVKRTTLYYTVLLQYYSVLQSTTPALLCTTKYYKVPLQYYKVLAQYYSVLQSTTPVLHSTTPVLLCTTKYYSRTTLYYKVLLQYYSELQSTTPVLLCTTTPVLLCTTKYYSSTTLYYKVLLQYYSVLQSTSSTAQGGGGSFKNRKPIGEIGCCESRMAEQKHWWIELSNCVTDWPLEVAHRWNDYGTTDATVAIAGQRTMVPWADWQTARRLLCAGQDVLSLTNWRTD